MKKQNEESCEFAKDLYPLNGEEVTKWHCNHGGKGKGGDSRRLYCFTPRTAALIKARAQKSKENPL